MAGHEGGQLIALSHRMSHRMNKVEGDLAEDLRMAGSHEVDEPDGDVELQVRSENGDTDWTGPGFHNLQEPIGPINGGLGCEADLQNNNALLKKCNFMLRQSSANGSIALSH